MQVQLLKCNSSLVYAVDDGENLNDYEHDYEHLESSASSS